MKEITTKVLCDSCGREIIENNPTIPWSEYPFYSGSVSLHIRKWGGGSIGGDENIFNYEGADLCAECARKIERFIRDEMGIKKIKL